MKKIAAYIALAMISLIVIAEEYEIVKMVLYTEFPSVEMFVLIMVSMGLLFVWLVLAYVLLTSWEKE